MQVFFARDGVYSQRGEKESVIGHLAITQYSIVFFEGAGSLNGLNSLANISADYGKS